MTAIIHVNRQFIAMNAKDGGNRPVYTIKRKGQTRYAREVVINGPSRLVYDGTQLACGARAWVSTESELTLIDECLFHEAKHWNIKHENSDRLFSLPVDAGGV